MKSKILSFGSVVLLSLLTPLWAADVAGNWIAKVGTVETIFSFRVEGTKLTGTAAGAHAETAIIDGKINGDEISFAVVQSSPGNVINIFYKGKVELNEIMFTREIEGEAGKAQRFVAKREFQRHNDFIPPSRAIPVPPPQ